MSRQHSSSRREPMSSLSRRKLVAASVALGVTGPVAAAWGDAPRPSAGRALRVAVVGAGAFGGWTALQLQRAGCAVTLLDAWGAGNSRSSSGGETRVIRAMYGPDRLYVEWAVRAFAAWREAEQAWGTRLLEPVPTVWLFEGSDDYARSSMPALAEAGLAVRELSLAECRRRYPQISFDGVASVYLEEQSGYLMARSACQDVARALVAAGGSYLEQRVEPGPIVDGRMERVALADGSTLEADAYVFACGPWLGRLFPEDIGERIRPTRQDVCFFGTPAGDPRFGEAALPIFIEFGQRVMYAIPGNRGRGLKVADDTHGAPIDPSTLERVVEPSSLARARELLRRRLPALSKAPLVESRVCQYENTPDGHYVIDRHPRAENVWLVGGGSGHGFKMGPAVGEHVAGLVAGAQESLPKFSLSRFAAGGDQPARSQLRPAAERGD